MAMVMMLVLGLLVLAEASSPIDPCYLRQVRGCGSGAVFEEEYMRWWVKSAVGDSVLAATLTDVVALDDSYVILMEMPGVNNTTLKVEYTDDLLSVTGISQDVSGGHRRERGALTKLFGRKLILPRHAELERVSVELSNGLLKVTVPHVRRGEEESGGVVEESRGVLVFRLPNLSCIIEAADEYMVPEHLSSGIPDCGSAVDHIITPPLMDTVYEDKHIEFTMEMPGVQLSGVEVVGKLVEDGSVLDVRGVVRDEAMSGGKVLRMDRGGAPTKVFARSIYLEPEVNADFTNVSYQLSGDGLLKVTVPIVRQRLPRNNNKPVSEYDLWPLSPPSRRPIPHALP